MNVLFLSIGRMQSINAHGLYPDLLRQFIKDGHDVYVVSQREKRETLKSEIVSSQNCKILYVKTGNITKCSTLRKGISTLMIPFLYKKAIKKYFKGITFDLILYPTPPITLASVVKFIKKRDNAKTYLMLKDIFPQNAVDLGMMKKTGLKSILYKYFRKQEKKLYRISDYIGCMSPANVEYVLKHNVELSKNKVGLCPNAFEPIDLSITENEKKELREKYALPLDKKIFVYGGNLGKPQGINFLIDCIRSQSQNDAVFFLIIGSGTEYVKLQNFVETSNQSNIKLMNYLPKEDYEKIVATCDAGMIFLDYRFTIPNFPSRLLGYMQAKKPVLACTDVNSDIGDIIIKGNFGWWCESNSIEKFDFAIREVLSSNTLEKGELAHKYFLENYTTEKVYQSIKETINQLN